MLGVRVKVDMFIYIYMCINVFKRLIKLDYKAARVFSPVAKQPDELKVTLATVSYTVFEISFVNAL